VGKKEDKEKNVERFYALLKALMDELFEYAPKSKHLKLPYNVFYGLIYDDRNSVVLTGADQKTGKKLYLYNVRVIGRMFEEKREKMLEDDLKFSSAGLPMCARCTSARSSTIMWSTCSTGVRVLQSARRAR
jgi:hypothetical protein